MILGQLLAAEESRSEGVYPWVIVNDPHEIIRVLWRFGIEDEYAEGGYDFLVTKIGPYFEWPYASSHANWLTYRAVCAGRGHPYAMQSVSVLISNDRIG